MYKELAIDPSTSMPGFRFQKAITETVSPENIVFSDGLHIDKAIELARASRKAGIGCSMGVGTFFTNDFVKRDQPDKSNQEGEGEAPSKDAPKSAPLNMWVYFDKQQHALTA